MLLASPVVQNPSFEVDAFSAGSGMASGNGGKISGWLFSGNAGINPLAGDPQKAASPFWDNGIVPHGRQFAFIQNQGSLKQTVLGFESGKRYRLSYRENARHTGDGEPEIEVLAGGATIVSKHALSPCEGPRSFETAFYLVRSAVFTVSKNGAVEIEFRKPLRERTTVYLDQVSILEVTNQAEIQVDAK